MGAQNASTPGPWRVVINRDKTINVVGADDDEGFSCKIALINNRDHANARLIAAAPELLAAIRALLALRENTDMTHEDAYFAMFKSEGAEAWGAAFTALARAQVQS